MNKLGLSLNLMPSFYHKHLGVNYGEGYYFAPVPAQTTELWENIISATSTAPQTLICAWSLDRETPIGNLEAICSTVNKYQG